MARAVQPGRSSGRPSGAVSRLYVTEPVGFTDQPDFRNAVVADVALDGPAGRHHGRRAGAARLAQGTRARFRPGRARALGSARARSRPPDLRARAPVGRSAARSSLQRRGDRPGEGHEAARRPASGRGDTAVRPRAAGRPGAATRAARLGRHGRDGAPPPAGDRGTGRRAPDRYLGTLARRLASGSAQVARRQHGLHGLAGWSTFHPIGAGVATRRDHLRELGAVEHERGAVVGCVAGRQGALGDERW